MESYDVIVIGAGYGGATVAALLAHAGKRVALIEKTALAGGKTQTIDRKGYKFEMFGAVGIPANNSRFHELVEVLGVTDRVEFVVPEGNAASIRYKRPDGEWRTMYSPLQQTGAPEEMEALKRVFGVTDEELGALTQLYAAVLTLKDEELEVLDDVGMFEWMGQFDLPTSLESQICMNLNTLFVVPVNRLAASEAILTMRQQVLGGAGRYSIGGYGRVAEVCAEYVTEHGGVYLPKTRVKRILVEEGRVVGIETDAGEVRARAVVSNAGIQPTVLKLAGREHFPTEYVERIESLEPSWAIAGCRYVLDERIFDAALIPIFSDQSWLDDDRFASMERGDWPEVPLIAIDVPTEFDPSLSPEPGHQIANCQVFCSADPNSDMTEEAIRRGEAIIDELWPELKHHILRKEPYGPKQVSGLSRDSVLPGCGGEAVGIAQVVGQCGRSKPDPRTPLPGLYIVGCDAGGRGAGTHQAVDSGFTVAALVNDDLA
ncbi:MAG: NAD(P)/FAD-dependent oxidoreductase [Deltaproteobacteria bacterium]|nr:NAD(P)/FAD-dependent oxidoreductase [Deltaproteobacteria bacterium]MBW2390469.1 NAD(P)/FAD-dependent oxidoreductase [Deltaproteobacteria bacterium]